MYPFIISSVIPRPIAFVSSLSKEVSMATTSGHAKIHAQLIPMRVAGFCVHYIRAVCNALLILAFALHSLMQYPANPPCICLCKPELRYDCTRLARLFDKNICLEEFCYCAVFLHNFGLEWPHCLSNFHPRHFIVCTLPHILSFEGLTFLGCQGDTCPRSCL